MSDAPGGSTDVARHGPLPQAHDGLEKAGPTANRPGSGPCDGQRGFAAPIADTRGRRCPQSSRTAQAPGRGGRSAEPRPGRCSPAPEEPEAGEALVAVPAARRRRPPLGIGSARRPGGGGGGGRGGGRRRRGRAAGRRRLCRLHGRAGGSTPPLPARRSALRLHARGGTEGDGREAVRAPAPPSPAAGQEVRPRTGGPRGRTGPTAPPAAVRAPRAGHLLPRALLASRAHGLPPLGQGSNHHPGLQRGDGAPASVSPSPGVTNLPHHQLPVSLSLGVTESQCHQVPASPNPKLTKSQCH